MRRILRNCELGVPDAGYVSADLARKRSIRRAAWSWLG